MNTLGIETLLLVGLGLGLASRRPLRALLGESPRRYQVLFVAILMAVFGAQIVKNPFLTYPLANWAMYSQRASGDGSYVNLTLVLENGRETRLPIETLYRTLRGKLRARINRRVTDLNEAAPGRDWERAHRKLVLHLTAIVSRWDDAHPDDPARGVRMESCGVPLEGYEGRSSIRCRTVLDWERS